MPSAKDAEKSCIQLRVKRLMAQIIIKLRAHSTSQLNFGFFEMNWFCGTNTITATPREKSMKLEILCCVDCN